MTPRILRPLATLLLLASAARAAVPPPAAPQPQPGPLRVGIRRSSYGYAAKNKDDAWWIARAQAYAAQFPGAQPAIIEILSNFDDSGDANIEFPAPPAYHGAKDHMRFENSGLDHERALAAYDQAGVKAILEFEPGAADVPACFDLAQAAFGKHPSVIGYGIDGEWYKADKGKNKAGVPIGDADAQAWTQKVLAFNKDYTLFLKHWEPAHMPPKYRHASLWFLNDSQEFASVAEWMADMKAWGDAFPGSGTGYQFGYPADSKWWGALANPPREMAARLQKDIASTRYIFWVDFSAGKVAFE